MSDAKDTFLMEGESNALTFLLIPHTYLSSLKRFIHRHFKGIGESMRDKMNKTSMRGNRIHLREISLCWEVIKNLLLNPSREALLYKISIGS